MEQRADKIEQGLLAAEANVKEQQNLQENIKNQLQKAQKEAAEIKAAAKKEAQKDAQEIIAKAHESAKTAIDKERTAFKAQMADQKRQAQKQLADLVTQTTASVLSQELTKDQQHQIIKAQLDKIKGVNFA